MVFIPNAKAFGDVVTNYTDIDRRRIELHFGVGYGDDLGRASAIATRVAGADQRVLKTPAPWCKPPKRPSASPARATRATRGADFFPPCA